MGNTAALQQQAQGHPLSSHTLSSFHCLPPHADFPPFTPTLAKHNYTVYL